MKKGTKCIVQAINLSVPNRSKQIQKLVSAELVEPCPHFEHGSSSYWIPKPVHIKICTRKDMERMCPPKICVCPSKPKPRTKDHIFFQMVGFILKSAIVGTLVYWMYTDGTLPFFPDIDKIDIPSLEKARYSLIQKYNHTVFNIMSILIEIPQKIHQKFSNIFCRQEKANEKTTEEDYSDFEDNKEKFSRNDR